MWMEEMMVEKEKKATRYTLVFFLYFVYEVCPFSCRVHEILQALVLARQKVTLVSDYGSFHPTMLSLFDDEMWHSWSMLAWNPFSNKIPVSNEANNEKALLLFIHSRLRPWLTAQTAWKEMLEVLRYRRKNITKLLKGLNVRGSVHQWSPSFKSSANQ